MNGGQNAADRKALLEEFKAAPRGLITNARCLTEGVDVPAVDMVAFVDPRKSKIDIAQAAGRAMRQSKATNKKLGYIVVPLFIEQKKGETEAEAFTRAGFDEVAEVLGAMLESDDDLVDTIKELQEARGRGEKFNPRQLHEKIEVIGPVINLEKLTQSIDVEILDRLGIGWDRWFGLLQRFHKRKGHCNVPQSLNVKGFNLGAWVAKKRTQKNKLSKNQIAQLDGIDFIWDPHSILWDENFSALRKYQHREGHSNVPLDHCEGTLKLGNWVGTQRQKRNKLTQTRVNLLESLGFSWNPYANQWLKGLQLLKKFHAREGHYRVPLKHIENDVKLGVWASNQRDKRKTISVEQLDQLREIGFSLDPLAEQWEVGYDCLKQYWLREGNCVVAQKHVEEGFKLGAWVHRQRMRRTSNQILPDRVKRLNSLGFIWKP